MCRHSHLSWPPLCGCCSLQCQQPLAYRVTARGERGGAKERQIERRRRREEKRWKVGVSRGMEESRVKMGSYKEGRKGRGQLQCSVSRQNATRYNSKRLQVHSGTRLTAPALRLPVRRRTGSPLAATLVPPAPVHALDPPTQADRHSPCPSTAWRLSQPPTRQQTTAYAQTDRQTDELHKQTRRKERTVARYSSLQHSNKCSTDTAQETCSAHPVLLGCPRVLCCPTNASGAWTANSGR